MATIEQRVSYTEGKMESLATREDLAKEMGALEVRLTDRINRLDASIAWKLAGIVVGGMTGGMAATAAILRLLG